MTKQDALAVLKVMEVMLELIKAKGDMGQPLGEMYAHMMGKISIDTFNRMVEMLEKANRIKVSNHCAYYNTEAKAS
jgi:hypothetical protein